MRAAAPVIAGLASCVLAGMAMAGVEPEVRIRETRQEYLVAARGEAELYERLRVGRGEMGHARGLTEGRLTITRNLTQTVDACIINAVVIELDITTMVPAWDPQADMPPALQRSWRSLSRMVYAHEDRHRQHLVDAAFAIRDAVAAIEPGASCLQVEAQLKRIVDREDMKRQLKDQVLDRQRQWPGR